MRRTLAWAARLGLAFAGVATALALVEAAARLLPAPDTPEERVRTFAAAAIQPDPRRSHRIRPSARVTVGGIDYRFSSLGTRGPEPGDPPRALRVLALGDSVTMGWGVAEAGTWPAVAAVELRRAGLDVEVVDAGVPGYGTRDEAALLDELDGLLRPDLVLVGYYPNDPEDTETAVRPPGTGWSRAWRLLLPRLRWLAVAWGLRPGAADALRSLHEPGSESWHRVEAALDAIGRRCAGRPGHCAVVLLPALMGPAPAWEGVHAQVAARARQAGLAVLDLLPGVAATPPEARWIDPADPHPDAATHALYGRAVARWILDARLLDGAPAGPLPGSARQGGWRRGDDTR